MKLNMFLFTALLVFLVNGINVVHSVTYDMDDGRDSINVYAPPSLLSSGTLKSQFGSTYITNRNKTLILSAPSGYGIMAAFRFIDLRPNNQDILTLFDNRRQASPVKYSNPFSIRRKESSSSEDYYTYYAPSGQLGVTFTTGPYFNSHGYDGFKLIYTVQGKMYGDCGSFEFWCNNGRCISDSWKCDGHNNCGDRSDEKYCSGSTGKKVGIGFGVTFLVIAIICGIFIAVRRGRVTRTEVRTVHPPPGQGTYYPPPPPPYSTNQGVNNPGFR